MRNLSDTAGLLHGLETLTANFDDTKIISYLATNSTSGNHLGLKEQAQEFAGNWAQENITDIRKIPLPELLQYNLIDALSTAYVHEKNTPIMIADNQEAIYKDIMLPSVKTILQMELTGMPIKWNALMDLEKFLSDKIDAAVKAINDHHIIKTLTFLLQEEAMDTANSKLKTKQHAIDKFADFVIHTDGFTGIGYYPNWCTGYRSRDNC
jgi:DNA polymerase-1